MEQLNHIKETLLVALICSGLGFCVAALVGGGLLLVIDVISPGFSEEDPSSIVMAGWCMVWTSVVTMMWVRTNGLPGQK